MRATRECPSEEELTDALTSAARTAIGALYRDNPDHRFYYIALITPAEAYGPALSAWSQEALAERSGTVEFRYNYADSPFDVVYEEFMAPVRELFAARPHWYSSR